MNLRRHSMSHLKVHLRFHLKKHKKLQRNVKKKTHLTCSWWFTCQCNQEYRFEPSYASFISYIEQNKQNYWHDIEKQTFTDIYSCLQKKDYSWVSFLLKSQTNSLKRTPPEMFGWRLLPLNTIDFHFYVDLISKMLLSTLAISWLSLNIFKANTVNHLWTAVSGGSRQLVDFLLIKQSICSKCSS